jgi:hypothetical protein
MLSKTERKLRLMEAAIRRGMFAGAAVFVAVSKGEIRETVKETVAPIAPQMEDDTQDEETANVKSQLTFDEIKSARERETDSLLSPAEKAQLKRELAASRAARNLSAV